MFDPVSMTQTFLNDLWSDCTDPVPIQLTHVWSFRGKNEQSTLNIYHKLSSLAIEQSEMYWIVSFVNSIFSRSDGCIELSNSQSTNSQSIQLSINYALIRGSAEWPGRCRVSNVFWNKRTCVWNVQDDFSCEKIIERPRMLIPVSFIDGVSLTLL